MTTSSPARVLYIEDEQSLCDLFKLSVGAKGYQVTTENSGRTGLDRFELDQFDVVAVDYQLPDMTGIEVGEVLKKNNPDLPMLLITGQGSERLVVDAFSIGFSNYVVKEDASVFLELIPGIIQTLVKAAFETKQKHEAEKQFIEKQQQLRSIFENTASGMISIDEDGIIEMVNPAALKLFGYTEQELVGANAEVLSPQSTNTNGPSDLAKLLNNDAGNMLGTGQDVLRRRKDGSLVPVHMVVSEATVGNNKYFTAIFTDLTERLEAERTRRLLELGLDNIDEALALYDKDDKLVYFNQQYMRNPAGDVRDEIKPGISFASMLRIAVESGDYKTEGLSQEEFFQRRLERHNTSSEPFELETINGHWLSFRKFKTQDDGFVFLRQDITEQKLAAQKTKSLNEELEQRVQRRTDELVEKIREQKQVEEALRTSESRIRTIVESVNDGIITFDEKNCIESFNTGAQKMFGYSLDEVLGIDFSDMIAAPERKERRKTNRDDTTDRRKDAITRPYQEIRAVRKDGTIFPIELNLNELTIGKASRYVGTIRDLTERRTAEKARREIEARFRSVVDSSPSSILIKDLDDNLIIANRQWHTWFNPEHRNIEGLKVRDFFKNDHVKAMNRISQEIFETKKPQSFELETPLADGRILSSIVQNFPILDVEENVVAVGSMITDISERVRAEEERRLALAAAERASRAKSDFLAAMSHELRTPLNAILGFSEIISQQYMGPIHEEKYVAYAKDIHASSELLLSLVNNILDLSAIEAGAAVIKKEPINLTEIIAECSVAYRADSDRRGIDLVVSFSPDNRDEFYADRSAFKTIFSSLLDNAMGATPEGGQIIVHSELKDDHLRMDITDTGSGISAELLKLLKQPFVRGEADPHRAHGGAGLGLTIVQSLIDMHNGSLNIKSELGTGTTVTVILPSSGD